MSICNAWIWYIFHIFQLTEWLITAYTVQHQNYFHHNFLSNIQSKRFVKGVYSVVGLSGIPVFKELFKLRSAMTFLGKWKTWWSARNYLWPPVAISSTRLLPGRNWGPIDGYKEVADEPCAVCPSCSIVAPLAAACGGSSLDLPLSRRETWKSQHWARQQTSFMWRQKEKLREEVWVLSSPFCLLSNAFLHS